MKVIFDWLDGEECALVHDELTKGPILGYLSKPGKEELTSAWSASRNLESITMSTFRNHQFSDNTFVSSPEKEKYPSIRRLREKKGELNLADWTRRARGHKLMYDKSLYIRSRYFHPRRDEVLSQYRREEIQGIPLNTSEKWKVACSKNKSGASKYDNSLILNSAMELTTKCYQEKCG